MYYPIYLDIEKNNTSTRWFTHEGVDFHADSDAEAREIATAFGNFFNPDRSFTVDNFTYCNRFTEYNRVRAEHRTREIILKNLDKF